MTIANRRKFVSGWIFATSIASTLLGLCLLSAFGFHNVSWWLTIGGLISWAVFGNIYIGCG